MIGHGEGQGGGFARPLIMQHIIPPAFQNGALDVTVKLTRPLEAAGRVPVHAGQVVHHVAAAHDQGALIAQGAQGAADGLVFLHGGAGIDAQLKDGDICLGVHAAQHRPGAVIDAPAVVCLSRRGQHRRRAAGGIGRACRRVDNAVQGIGKAVHVIDRPGVPGVHHPCAQRIPVGGDRDDAGRAGQALAQCLPDCGKFIVFNGIHGRTVPDEQNRHFAHSGTSIISSARRAPGARLCQPSSPSDWRCMFSTTIS